MWTEEGACATQRLSPEHSAQVDALLNRETGARLAVPDGVTPAQLVSVVRF